MRGTPILLLCGCLMVGTVHASPAEQAGAVAAQEVATGEGSSMREAIVITETTETTGIAAEYKWVAEHFPGYKMKGQSLLFEMGRYYDLLEFVDADGAAHAVYFDITNFFGKM